MKIDGKQFESEDVIAILARNLYYQNLIAPAKIADPLITKELDNIYRTISIDNLNSKRKFIFNNYLVYDSENTAT
jgi:hypothetical protein